MTTVGKNTAGAIELTDELRLEYHNMFATCAVRNGTEPHEINWTDRAMRAVSALLRGRARYLEVGNPLGIPWYFIAAIHAMETSVNFTLHLHNGDPLTSRTTHVPAGRPAHGNPPFTWEASARDALMMKRLEQWDDWTVAGMLYQLERYNGFGYRKRGLVTPYLWSGSRHYTRGKYVADGRFDPKATSAQVGAAVLIKVLRNRDLIAIAGE